MPARPERRPRRPAAFPAHRAVK
ncbi:hypothetical protein, partial [Mesorhizobium sp.]